MIVVFPTGTRIEVLRVREKNVSKRVQLYLPDAIYEQLGSLADLEGRKIANLCTFLIEQKLREIYPNGLPVVAEKEANHDQS